LYSISQRFNTTVDAIVAANNLPSRNAILRVGQVLVIPG
jgi:LysM repeat protein